MKLPTRKQHVNMTLVPEKIIEDYKEYQSENAALREALKELIPIAEHALKIKQVKVQIDWMDDAKEYVNKWEPAIKKAKDLIK